MAGKIARDHGVTMSDFAVKFYAGALEGLEAREQQLQRDLVMVRAEMKEIRGIRSRTRLKALKAEQAQPTTQAANMLGQMGGKARARKLTPERRREISSKAANARWAKRAEG